MEIDSKKWRSLITKSINPHVLKYIKEDRCRYGIIVTDFITKDYAKEIVLRNQGI